MSKRNRNRSKHSLTLNRGLLHGHEPVGPSVIELQSKWQEQGTPGLDTWSGFVQKAYSEDLFWPDVFPLYNRIRRSDPEISIVRGGYQALARKVEIEVVTPEPTEKDDPVKPTSDDKAAVEFFESELDNQDGGITRWLETNASHTPFLGWSWWWVTPGLRRKDWRPPDDDPWRSEADDDLIGVRRLAWRDQSSFERWDLDDYGGRLKGMWQLDPPNQEILLPLENSLHVTFGDPNNPEGLTPLEAVWRLERLKYGFEQVNGIGYEHAAGYLDVTSENSLTAADLTHVRSAARAILTAQEGNYAAWPKGVKGEIKDVSFGAGPALLETIRYYGLLKLQLYHMQWVAIASTVGTGAYSAMSDASSMFLMWWNAMQSNFVEQYDQQIGKLLWKWNKDSFPGATARPRYQAKTMNKVIDLTELGAFIAAMKNAGIPLGEKDFIEIRKRSSFLPETLPEPDEIPKPPAPPKPEKPATDQAAETQAEGDMEPGKETTDDEGKTPAPKDEKKKQANLSGDDSDLALLARAIDRAAEALELEFDPNQPHDIEKEHTNGNN